MKVSITIYLKHLGICKIIYLVLHQKKKSKWANYSAEQGVFEYQGISELIATGLAWSHDSELPVYATFMVLMILYLIKKNTK